MRNSARGKLQPPGRSLRADCSVPLGRQQSWVIEHMLDQHASNFSAAEAQSSNRNELPRTALAECWA